MYLYESVSRYIYKKWNVKEVDKLNKDFYDLNKDFYESSYL